MQISRINRIMAAVVTAVMSMACHGATIELWSGNEAANWDNGLQVSTAPASGKCSAGDCLEVVFDGSGWFKINRWSPWKNFYEGDSGSGSFTLALTSSNINEIIGSTLQFQGQGLTFRKIRVVTGGGSGETPTPPVTDPSLDFMSLDDAIYSGASRSGNQVKFEPQGAMGWYWHDGKNLTGCKSISVDFGNGAPADFVVQVFYHDALDTASARIPKGTSAYNFNLADNGVDTKDVYSVNLVSRSGNEATATLNSFVALDAAGNQWKPGSSIVTSIEETGASEVITVEFYNLQGIKVDFPTGFVVKRITHADGSVVSEKVIISGNRE